MGKADLASPNMPHIGTQNSYPFNNFNQLDRPCVAPTLLSCWSVMRCSTSVLTCLGITLTLAFLLPQDSRAGPLNSDLPDPGLVAYPVRVALEASFIEKHGKEEAEQLAIDLVNRASSSYSKFFDIVFMVKDTTTWTQGDLKDDALFEGLAKQVEPPKGKHGGFVFAFTNSKLSSDDGNLTPIGMAITFNPYVVIRDVSRKGRNDETVLHEIAHTFGAFHIDLHCTLMSPTTRKGYCTNRVRFHSATRQVIQAAKHFHFGSPIEDLAPEARTIISEMFLEHRMPGECSPLTKTYGRRAKSLSEKNPSKALSLYEEAIEYDPTCATPRKRYSVALMKANSFAKAVPQLQWLLENASLSFKARQTISFLLSKAHMALNEMDKAGKIFSQTVMAKARQNAKKRPIKRSPPEPKPKSFSDLGL